MKNTRTTPDHPTEPVATGTTTPGLAPLFALLDAATVETGAAVWACLTIAERNPEVGRKIVAYIEPGIASLREGDYGDADLESDVVPAKCWLAFADGFAARQ
ncbi:MAG: hypothetical protein ACYTAS_15985 [Planctomycetota bacterium]|jgi:hypothetical protein